MHSKKAQEEIAESMKVVDLQPSLEEAVARDGLDRTKLLVQLPVSNDLSKREHVSITDGEKHTLWVAPSLRSLFRGDKVPPVFSGEPPPAYLPLFHFIESHAATFCATHGDKTDGEFEEAYGNLRRRPDGKPINALHLFMWQVAAVLAAKRPVSAAEFDAIFTRLTKSARTFGIGLVSRNYAATLRGFAQQPL